MQRNSLRGGRVPSTTYTMGDNQIDWQSDEIVEAVGKYVNDVEQNLYDRGAAEAMLEGVIIEGQSYVDRGSLQHRSDGGGVDRWPDPGLLKRFFDGGGQGWKVFSIL